MFFGSLLRKAICSKPHLGGWPCLSPGEKQVCLRCFQDLFGDDHNKNGFKMFDSSNYHGQDLLFKDATVRAVPVGEKTTYSDWLGLDYVAALEGMLSQQCSGAGRTGPPRRLPGAVQTALPQNLEGAGRGCCGSGEAGGGRFTAVRVGCPGRILARRLRARRAGARRVSQTKLGHECKRSKRGAGRI